MNGSPVVLPFSATIGHIMHMQRLVRSTPDGGMDQGPLIVCFLDLFTSWESQQESDLAIQ